MVTSIFRPSWGKQESSVAITQQGSGEVGWRGSWAAIPNQAAILDIEQGKDVKLSNLQAVAAELGLEVGLVEVGLGGISASCFSQ